MKYKILLNGSNRIIVDDFFSHMLDEFECMTTSARLEDVKCHLEYFKPDAYVYGIHKGTFSSLDGIPELKSELKKREIPFVLLGTKEDCDNFERRLSKVVDLSLPKPITSNMIKERIIKYIRETRRDKEEEQERIRIAEELRVLEEDKNRRRHIMIVDDDTIMLKTVKRYLEEDYDVATAISGKLALRFLEKKRTDLILLDYEMPEENGPEVLEKLRRNPDTANIPVIFLTGIRDHEKIKKALSMKPQGYLLKPIEHDKLNAILKKFLS